MMTELSLNILDIAENSIRAGASLITIDVETDTAADRMSIFIEDDGCGMTPEQIAQAEDPFYTTRTTRKVGLGLSFFKLAAQMTGGDFSIWSEEGKGTIVRAEFVRSHVDCLPLGDISSTIHTLMIFNPSLDFSYRYGCDGRFFSLKTTELRGILGDIPFDTPEVSEYILSYLRENKQDIDGGAVL